MHKVGRALFGLTTVAVTASAVTFISASAFVAGMVTSSYVKNRDGEDPFEKVDRKERLRKKQPSEEWMQLVEQHLADNKTPSLATAMACDEFERNGQSIFQES